VQAKIYLLSLYTICVILRVISVFRTYQPKSTVLGNSIINNFLT